MARGRRVAVAALSAVAVTAAVAGAAAEPVPERTLFLECAGSDAVRAGEVNDAPAPGTDPADASQRVLNLIGAVQDPPLAPPVRLPFEVRVTGDAPRVLPTGETGEATFTGTPVFSTELRDQLLGRGVTSLDVTAPTVRTAVVGGSTATPNPLVGTGPDRTIDLTVPDAQVPPVQGTFTVTATDDAVRTDYVLDEVTFGVAFTVVVGPPTLPVPTPVALEFGLRCTPVPAGDEAARIFASTNGEPPPPPPPPGPPPTAAPTTTTTSPPTTAPAAPAAEAAPAAPRFAG